MNADRFDADQYIALPNSPYCEDERDPLKVFNFSPSNTIDQLHETVSVLREQFPEHVNVRTHPHRDPLIGCINSVVNSIADQSRILTEANEQSIAKSNFLASLGPEIRSPINSLFGLVNLLTDTGLDEQQQEYVRLVQRCGEQLDKITKDVLVFSKLNARQHQLRASVFELDQLIGEVVQNYQSEALEKQVSIALSIDEEIQLRRNGDESGLHQVLSHLVSYSLGHVAGDPVTIYVQQPEPETAPEYLMFSVCMGRIPASAETMQSLFVSASQSHTTTSEGLGLDICQRIVEMMGGVIWAESHPVSGAHISFTVKLECCLEQSNHVVGSRDDMASLNPTPKESVKVLLVEDNELNRKVATLSLQKLSCEVDSAENGEIAVEMASGDKVYNLICMDVSMPVMNGLDATRLIRTLNHPNSKTGIIAMTGMAFAQDLESCIEAGVDGFITKPFDIGELKKAVDQFSI